MTMCALEPPNPNALMEARLSPRLGQTTEVVGNLKFHSLAWIFGFGFSNQQFGGIMPHSSTKTDFNRPAMPAAPSRWPMLLLGAPMYIGSSGDLYFVKTELIALASIGSPTGVPVPCAQK